MFNKIKNLFKKKGNKNGLIFDLFGNKYWYLNNKLHRLDGPAIEYIDGGEEWYNDGKLHRLNGPAYNFKNIKIWYQDGYRHRSNGPAFTCSDGSKSWFLYGKRHRLDGPAVIYSNGVREWWFFGVLQNTVVPKGYSKSKGKMVNLITRE